MAALWAVALLSPPFATLTYAAPDEFPESAFVRGGRVLAPLGGSNRVGLLLRRQDAPPPGVDVKPMLWPLDPKPLLTPGWVDLLESLALSRVVEPGFAAAQLLPRPLRTAAVAFRSHNRRYEPKDVRNASPELRTSLAQAFVRGEILVTDAPVKARKSAHFLLAKDPPWPVRPSAIRQIAVLDFIFERGKVDVGLLKATLGPEGLLAARKLVGLGVLAERFDQDENDLDPGPVAPESDFSGRIELNPEQAAALADVTTDLARENPGARLLFGVTGSGKTALYLEAGLAALKRGRSVLLLAPEIALAHNLYKAAQTYYPGAAVYFHSGALSPEKRAARFREIAAAKGPVVVAGTRSALFLPFRDLGLIVLDEEHDASFKQSERFNYQAKEAAHFLGRAFKAPLLLGSATPDVKTFYAALTGRIGLSTLAKRVMDRPLPTVELVDVAGRGPEDPVLAPRVVEALRDVLAAGGQAAVLINRRGYAPVMYCTACGRAAQCPDCAVSYTYHQARNRLVCHYCDQTAPFPLVCPGCGNSNWLPLGEGSERLEQTLANVLPPKTGVVRLDRDAVKRPGAMEAVLDRFAKGKAQVIVGTQMLSKGHHFPNVRLVVAADGDLGLNVPDFRAVEKSFQLIVQTSGRAGRGEHPGTVLIQTRNPAHPNWKAAASGDYRAFYEREIALRSQRRYPPFVKLALVRFEFPAGEPELDAWMPKLAAVAKAVAATQGVVVLGPAPAPIAMIRKRKRIGCLLKADAYPPLRAVFRAVKEAAPEAIHIHFDPDPVDML